MQLEGVALRGIGLGTCGGTDAAWLTCHRDFSMQERQIGHTEILLTGHL